MDRHCSNALRFASEFESHNKVAQVIYPYLPSHPQHALAKTQMSAGGGIVSLKLKGGKSETFNFINALRLPSITANLGDARTIVTHPATTTHSKLSVEEQVAVGIHPSTIRISIGLEDISDIIEDFEQALNIQV
jgi:O-succinylhomoserine sulfhydrylase